MNCYRYKCDDKILPSTSTILKSDPKLLTAAKSFGVANKYGRFTSDHYARHRGIAVHSAARKFVRTGEVDLDEQYFPYWENIHRSLSLLDPQGILWADGPVSPELMHLQQGEHSAVWNTKVGFVGCPDLVATCGGVPCLIEFKTSDHLYRSTYDMEFRNYGSWHRYHQASMQLSSYCNAFEQTTKLPIEAGIIIVGTKTDHQMFVLEKPELKKAFAKFKKLAKDFHKADSFVQPEPAHSLLVSAC